MPSGKTLTIERDGDRTLSDPANVFSLDDANTTMTMNGRRFELGICRRKPAVHADDGRRVASAPHDRPLGKPVNEQFGGLAPTAIDLRRGGPARFAYAGSGADARTITFAYTPQSYRSR